MIDLASFILIKELTSGVTSKVYLYQHKLSTLKIIIKMVVDEACSHDIVHHNIMTINAFFGDDNAWPIKGIQNGFAMTYFEGKKLLEKEKYHPSFKGKNGQLFYLYDNNSENCLKIDEVYLPIDFDYMFVHDSLGNGEELLPYQKTRIMNSYAFYKRMDASPAEAINCILEYNESSARYIARKYLSHADYKLKAEFLAASFEIKNYQIVIKHNNYLKFGGAEHNNKQPVTVVQFNFNNIKDRDNFNNALIKIYGSKVIPMDGIGLGLSNQPYIMLNWDFVALYGVTFKDDPKNKDINFNILSHEKKQFHLEDTFSYENNLLITGELNAKDNLVSIIISSNKKTLSYLAGALKALNFEVNKQYQYDLIRSKITILPSKNKSLGAYISAPDPSYYNVERIAINCGLAVNADKLINVLGLTGTEHIFPRESTQKALYFNTLTKDTLKQRTITTKFFNHELTKKKELMFPSTNDSLKIVGDHKEAAFNALINQKTNADKTNTVKLSSPSTAFFSQLKSNSDLVDNDHKLNQAENAMSIIQVDKESSQIFKWMKLG